MYECIASKDNARVKRVCKLISSSKERKKQKNLILEGLRLCIDAAQNLVEIKELYFTDEFSKKFVSETEFLCDSAKECFCVTSHVMEKMCDTVSPQGVIGVCGQPENFKSIDNIDPAKKYILLDNIADPANLGAISRNAEAFSIGGLILIGGCDVLSPKAQRAAMGALLRIPVFLCESYSNLRLLSTEKGMKIFSSTVRNADAEIGNVLFSKGTILVIGNEANGVSDDIIKSSDFTVTIPMTGRAESLNAASSAAIMIWEMMKG